MNILITGASTGIGYQTALILAAGGHTVYPVARRKDHLQKLKETIQKNNPSAPVYTAAGDIADEKFQDELSQQVASHTKTLDIIIHNAGLLISKPFEELTMKDWKDVYETNVFAVVGLTCKLLPLFSGPEKKHILNISSMGGFQGSAKFKGLSAYSSSKAALAGITECLAEEFKEKNIAVNCLCMGSVQTEMFAKAFPSYKASNTIEEAAEFIARFAIEGSHLFNGKILPVSNSTP